MTRPLVVLGATGSIGLQALEVARHLGRAVVGIAARRPRPELAALARSWPEAAIAVAGGSPSEREDFLAEVARPVLFGSEAVVELAGRPGTTVINGVVGSAGLGASVAALEAGNRLALANKESLVAGGPVVMAALRRGGGELIPVDSEHSALFQLMEAMPGGAVNRLLLTASGGPFRGRSPAELEHATPREALAHPTWKMGERITIDSATLVNKGMEVIEAHFLFQVPYERIDVVVHPESVVHSLVELTDGALIAHMGATDMRIPIQYAITHPERAGASVDFRLPTRALHFEDPDREVFPALELAYGAGRAGGSAPAVFNAADEVAVAAFLGGRLGFTGIPRLIERVLELMPVTDVGSVEEVAAVDEEARHHAAGLVAGSC